MACCDSWRPSLLPSINSSINRRLLAVSSIIWSSFSCLVILPMQLICSPAGFSISMVPVLYIAICDSLSWITRRKSGAERFFVAVVFFIAQFSIKFPIKPPAQGLNLMEATGQG